MAYFEPFTAENETGMRQHMLMLSLIAYVGTHVTNLPSDADLKMQIEEAMARSITLKEQWEIVWGPATYSYQSSAPAAKCDFPPPQDLKDIPGEEGATHMMFAVCSRQNPALYAVVIRGTNSGSCVNLWEDTWGFHTLAAWPYGTPEVGLSPQFAAGYEFALDALQAMTPSAAVPGCGQPLRDFLDAVVVNSETGAAPQVIVTGHSLGGGLAPTVALWLENTQASAWDLERRALISTYFYAAPSAGNRDFAAW
jgi:hypothetical protein